MIDYRVYNLTLKEEARLVAVSFVAAVIISELFFGSLLWAAAIALMYKHVRYVYCRYLNEKRYAELHLQFRDCLYSLAASFSSGRHMRDSVEGAYNSLSELYGKDSYMVKELYNMLRRMDVISEDEISVWRDFAERSDSEDVYSFIQLYEACRDVGGNIVFAINRAAIIITEKITVEHEIKNQIVQRRYEGRIIGMMPFVMLLFLRVMSPDYICVMYESFIGRIIMITALCLIAGAYILEEKITSIEV